MLKINKEKIKKGDPESFLVIPTAPKKINLKVHKADLMFIDKLASKLEVSRSLILNDIIKKILTFKLLKEVEEFDSKYQLALKADQTSPQPIIDGCNDLEESWIFELAREDIKKELLYRYQYYMISEEDQNHEFWKKNKIEEHLHSDEHNIFKSILDSKLRTENDPK